MDLALPVVYRGMDINSLAALTPGSPLDGYALHEARFQPVDGFGYSEKRSLADGYDYGKVFLGRRVLMLRGNVYASTVALLHDRIRLLRALFTPTLCYAEDPQNFGFLALDFSWRTEDIDYFPDGLIPVRLYVRPDEQPGVFFPRDASNGSDGRGYSEVFETTLVARDPRFYAQTTVEVAATATTGTGTVTNRGDYPTPLQFVLVLSGATSGPRTMTLTGFGSTMTVTVPAGPATRTVIIDGDKKVCTLMTGDPVVETLRMDLVHFAAAQTWPQVQPGDNTYDWVSTGGGKSAGSRLWFREAFV